MVAGLPVSTDLKIGFAGSFTFYFKTKFRFCIKRCGYLLALSVFVKRKRSRLFEDGQEC